MADLMILPPQSRLSAVARKGHAGTPGRGPDGETCGSCQNYTHNDNRTAKAYRKCRLMRAKWTGGPGSDVRKRDPACEKWERRVPGRADAR